MSIAVPPTGDTYFPLLEAELLRWVGSGDSLLELACLDALFPPGKLLRPVLCMESAKAVGGTADQVLAFAAGIECLHVASLVHDDIIDQDPVRRGRASNAEQYGLAEALVAGDGRSMAGIAALLSPGPAEHVLQAARVAVQALRHMCQGIMRETEIRGDLTCGVPTVLNVMQAKTAVLTGAACQAGAILVGAIPHQHQANCRIQPWRWGHGCGRRLTPAWFSAPRRPAWRHRGPSTAVRPGPAAGEQDIRHPYHRHGSLHCDHPTRAPP
ncbi:polyprenyl synthetase family protein [Streptomyces sp. NPDC001848]|uniref:polyprenyl synthetase family protein n=1 Tax=Streptomyces sp. NPDC001848 TaxID=3364618 RepID=UPI00369E0C87